MGNRVDTTAQLMKDLFEKHGDSSPVRVSNLDVVLLDGQTQTIRQLTAAIDIKAKRRVASYPVEIMRRDDEFYNDSMYVLEVTNKAGIPYTDVVADITPKSLRRNRKSEHHLPLAMFANEPKATETNTVTGITQPYVILPRMFHSSFIYCNFDTWGFGHNNDTLLETHPFNESTTFSQNVHLGVANGDLVYELEGRIGVEIMRETRLVVV